VRGRCCFLPLVRRGPFNSPIIEHQKSDTFSEFSRIKVSERFGAYTDRPSNAHGAWRNSKKRGPYAALLPCLITSAEDQWMTGG